MVFHRDAYGCRRDDVCTIARVGDHAVELAHPDGAPRRFRPSGNASRYLGVFDTRAIEVRAGERIRWTRNRKAPRARSGHPQAPDLVNGDTAEVLAIDDRRVHLRTEHGERIALARSDPQLRHLDHAYSTTVHGAQGRTARSVIAVLGSAGLTDQTMLYVEMSRASDEFVLLTDDREALAEMLLHRPGLEESALEAIGEALTSPPVVEPEVFDEWADSLGTMDGLPEATRSRIAALNNTHDACLRRRAEIEALPDRAAVLLAARDDNEHWHDDGAALIEAGRAMLAGAADRPHLDAMPGARNRIARALSPLVTALQAESTAALADGAYLLPCPDRVLPGDRKRGCGHTRKSHYILHYAHNKLTDNLL